MQFIVGHVGQRDSGPLKTGTRESLGVHVPFHVLLAYDRLELLDSPCLSRNLDMAWGKIGSDSRLYPAQASRISPESCLVVHTSGTNVGPLNFLGDAGGLTLQKTKQCLVLHENRRLDDLHIGRHVAPDGVEQSNEKPAQLGDSLPVE